MMSFAFADMHIDKGFDFRRLHAVFYEANTFFIDAMRKPWRSQRTLCVSLAIL